MSNAKAGTVPGMPGATSGPVPVMRMFGINRAGNSICCHVHGFHPYFYVTASPNFRKENLKDFREGLNAAIMNDLKSNNDGLVVAVLDVGLEQKSSIYGYQGLDLIVSKVFKGKFCERDGKRGKNHVEKVFILMII